MSWPIAEQSRRHVAVPQRKRRTPRVVWVLVAAAFLCGAALSAAGFAVGWKNQAQRGTSAESALVAATATTHRLRAQLTDVRARLSTSEARAVQLATAQRQLDHTVANLRTQLTAARRAQASVSAAAAPLAGDLDRLTNELHALTSYVTATPSGQLDAGYLQAQIAYVSKTAARLSSALAALAAPQN
jgi:chromosome segregation ATPase